MCCVSNCIICGWQTIDQNVCDGCSKEMEKSYLSGNALSKSAIKKIVQDRRHVKAREEAKERLIFIHNKTTKRDLK